ncbi:DUF4179 domain-containing protein [Niallia sp. NCCP-28]|uniref:DUF4179 domain-containing protein n=1 Tax=Niallia sp. NCCP-28 TaxID=2934712 RepID=UPI002086C7C3|nr:DUF4179 domain-containing protein [Niallia sp. NCCP-28]GKU83042.1 hypothetical protein NCCP28_24380 [Niallia sp. NCCP-28]
MENLFERVNEENMDLSEFEGNPLTDVEKKAIKKRIKTKLKRKSGKKRKVFAAVASLSIILLIEMNSNYALADIPVIGNALEKFVYSKEDSLHNYKTVIGETVEDNGMKVTLNEVLLDDGQLLISSTFHTNLTNKDLDYNWFSDIDVYINGKKSELSGGGGPNEITNSAVKYFWTTDLQNINMKDNQKIKIVFHNLERSDAKKIIKGKWRFTFNASGKKLAANEKIIPIDRSFTLEDNQKVTIEKLIITPVSTKLTYKINTADTDLSFRMHDQNGVELQGFSASTSGYDNYNRFIALQSTVPKLKVIPYITSYDEIDINEKILYDKVFEIKVK